MNIYPTTAVTATATVSAPTAYRAIAAIKRMESENLIVDSPDHSEVGLILVDNATIERVAELIALDSGRTWDDMEDFAVWSHALFTARQAIRVHFGDAALVFGER